jgi:hypothetical protein
MRKEFALALNLEGRFAPKFQRKKDKANMKQERCEENLIGTKESGRRYRGDAHVGVLRI